MVMIFALLGQVVGEVLSLFDPVVGETLLLGFFDLRSDVFNAKVVGVGQLRCARAGTGAHGLRSFIGPRTPRRGLAMGPLLWNSCRVAG
jgi:hypothetical protein